MYQQVLSFIFHNQVYIVKYDIIAGVHTSVTFLTTYANRFMNAVIFMTQVQLKTKVIELVDLINNHAMPEFKLSSDILRLGFNGTSNIQIWMNIGLFQHLFWIGRQIGLTYNCMRFQQIVRVFFYKNWTERQSL